MIEDAQGHALTGATSEAAAAFDEAVRAFNLVYGDAVGLFERAAEAAPGMPMARLAQAWVFAVANDPGLLAKVAVLVAGVERLMVNEREGAHLTALGHLVGGGRAAAVAVLDRHLLRHPFDLVAHQAAALIDGFLGRFDCVRDRSARALPFWSSARPGYATLSRCTPSGRKRPAIMRAPRTRRAKPRRSNP